VRLEEQLLSRAREALGRLRGVRRPETVDIFERLGYILPGDLRVRGYGRAPVAAFNPGALLRGRELWVFPRLVFDYHGYASSVGFFKLDAEAALSGGLRGPFEAQLLLWPRELWEFKGCEDARVSEAGGRLLVLYTGYGHHWRGESLETMWVQALAELDGGLRVVRRGFFRIAGGGEVLTPRMKDSALLEVGGSGAALLCRPTLGGLQVCWRGFADLAELTIDASSMQPVLVHEEWETHVGWSTNAVKISSNEYLVGWHGVLRGDLSYREGLALVSGDGELLAVSDYLLAPRGPVEEYGDRPLVIFGDGLAVRGDRLIWVGGVSDYAIGLFAADLDEALERLRWLSGAAGP